MEGLQAFTEGVLMNAKMHANSREYCIVIIDGAIRDLLKQSLLGAGYRVGTAVSGEAGIKIVREMYPDLLLLDVHLPGQDGLDVLRSLRNDIHFKNLPVVMITGDSDRSTVIRAIQRGASDYIIKPLRLDRILTKVAKLIEYYRRTQEIKDTNPGEIQMRRLPGACLFEFACELIIINSIYQPSLIDGW